MIIPVILSGGKGSRLWPISNDKKPKQFASLIGKKSLFQMTLERFKNLNAVSSPIVVCNKKHKDIVVQQLREFDKSEYDVILEAFWKEYSSCDFFGGYDLR